MKTCSTCMTPVLKCTPISSQCMTQLRCHMAMFDQRMCSYELPLMHYVLAMPHDDVSNMKALA